MDTEFIKYLGTLGIGGILAGFMFVFYRKDMQQYTELWKSSSDQLIAIVKDNTASNTRLIALIENQERNALRKDDLATMIDRRIDSRIDSRKTP